MDTGSFFQTNPLNGSGDPIYIDKGWLDTVVVVGLTAFILCLMGLSKVHTARMGILYGITGMAALIAAFWADSAYTYDEGIWLVAASMAPGAIVGLWSAYAAAMTTLPELVGAYNGFGGLAAALEAIGQYLDPNAKYIVRDGMVIAQQTDAMLWVQAIALLLSIIIGMATFTGSFVAVLKLHGIIASKPRMVPYPRVYNLFILTAIVVFGTLSFTAGQDWNDRTLGIGFIMIVTVLSGLYGFTAVMAIGGGDAPVSISFLNSLSGFSTSAAGFMLSNKALVVSGAFVGCSGIILTLVMCRAMNRNVMNVLGGGFGDGATPVSSSQTSDGAPEGKVSVISAEDVVEHLTGAKSVIIVPGYGMAVAKAQHAVASLSSKLRQRGIQCRYSIHPVAGRMPGHMNVLLAEANVPYDIICSMDQINGDFPTTDCVLIIGANDIVNPSAETDPRSPIAGMPVLQVWKAKYTIAMKRSLRPGYAGVDNPLFLHENNGMYLGDAKESVEKLVSLLGDGKGSSHTDLTDVEAALPTTKVEKIDSFVADMPSLQKDAFLKVGVYKEVVENERKVAIVPDGCKRLLKEGIQVYVQSGAGKAATFDDSDYKAHGAIILASAQDICDVSDVLVKIREPTIHPVSGKHELDMISAGKSVISFVGPRTSEGRLLLEKAKSNGVNLLAVDAIPRISRAQALDVLSSQAKIAGYHAVIQAASLYQKFMNGEVTAAGSFQAAKVLVIGAGVAGLAAIGCASSLGAIVRAFDTRLETKEQVESMGGEFLQMDFDEDGGESSGYAKVMSDDFIKKEMELFEQQLKEVSIVITTAAIPGMRAPLLLKQEAVDGMLPGSVIVDLAGATGGNCELTRPGETYVRNGVTIIGSDMTCQSMAWQASTMFSNNMVNLFKILVKDKKLELDMTDAIIRSMTCVFNNEIIFPPPPSLTQTNSSAPKKATQDLSLSKAVEKEPSFMDRRLLDLAPASEFVGLVVACAFFGVVAAFAPITFSQQLGYFVLAGFLGYYLIWNVDSALFSPLMSTSNAISGVVILGGILMASSERGSATSFFACFAVAVAAINVFGGFAVSYRMLLMFKKG